MMRGLQPMGTKVETAGDCRTFRVDVDITRQQQTLAPGVDTQHAGCRIAIRALLPAPGGEHHPIPLPARIALTQARVELRREPGQLTAQYTVNRKCLMNRRCAPGMIGVGVTDQHQVQMTHTGLAHGGHDHTLTDIELAETWTCVVQERVISSAQENGQALPHVQLQYFYLACWH